MGHIPGTGNMGAVSMVDLVMIEVIAALLEAVVIAWERDKEKRG
jgi:hypothetical protein